MSENNKKSEVSILTHKAKEAIKDYGKLDQEKIDYIVKQMALAGLANHMKLAKMAVAETNRGIYEDKIVKNMFASEYVYNEIKYKKTVGIIEDNKEEDYILLAEPIGVIAGVTPVTNPTSTTIFKALIAVKTRNPIIFSFHPSAFECSVESAKILKEAAVNAGAPKDCIQWITKPSIEATKEIMTNKDVDLILATGGPGMVKSAYSSGNPAIGVGPGNVPAIVEKTADIKRSLTDIIASKSFDNGMVCASEQGIIIEEDIYDQSIEFMKYNKCYFPDEKQISKLSELIIKKDGSVNSEIVGKYPWEIAAKAGFNIPKDTKVICCEIEDVGEEYPLSREKLSPVLAIFRVSNIDRGFELANKMLELGGLGHTSVIHSKDDGIIREFSKKMRTGRILVNCPSSQGAIGNIYNTLVPSLTLGCGSYGKNSTIDNVSVENLLNVKRMARRKVNMQWFKVPNKIYFEKGSIEYLTHMKDIKRVFIVTDDVMMKLGYLDKILYSLNNRKDKIVYEVFSEIEANPSFETINKGVERMNHFKPDTIISLGGGSPIDAGKGMWLFYENPDANLDAMKQKFMDIRKRVYRFPKMGDKSKFIAIPTTSGTGSEVTSFAVITDKTNNIKYPLADYELTPDIAIIDPDLVMSMPKEITANTGLDVLTHAIEAYVSVMASDYTDALAMKAIELVFKYLERAYIDGTDEEAREKMHNAATIAGMAFSNAFLGVNHSLAHKIGGEFHIAHGKANAILLPHVIKYNGEMTPTKFNSFPKYEKYIAPLKYADISRKLGLKASTDEEGVDSLILKIKDLMNKLNIDSSFEKCGIDEAKYMSKVEYLAERAFEDQCTSANPRVPLINELVEIYKKAYYSNYGEE